MNQKAAQLSRSVPCLSIIRLCCVMCLYECNLPTPWTAATIVRLRGGCWGSGAAWAEQRNHFYGNVQKVSGPGRRKRLPAFPFAWKNVFIMWGGDTRTRTHTHTHTHTHTRKHALSLGWNQHVLGGLVWFLLKGAKLIQSLIHLGCLLF